VNDGLLIEIVHGSHDPILEFLFGRDADVAEDGAGKFGEEALDEVEPGAVLGREGELELAGRSRGEPSPGWRTPELVTDTPKRAAAKLRVVEPDDHRTARLRSA
jgi:hypothetical protein